CAAASMRISTAPPNGSCSTIRPRSGRRLAGRAKGIGNPAPASKGPDRSERAEETLQAVHRFGNALGGLRAEADPQMAFPGGAVEGARLDHDIGLFEDQFGQLLRRHADLRNVG